MKQGVNVDVQINEVEAKLLSALGEPRGLSLRQVVGEAVIVYVQTRLRLWSPERQESDGNP